jgi:N-acetyl-gamma-glutamyl-phosphate reductase
MAKSKVVIAGSAGYTGGELIRILIHHPEVELVGLLSESNAGNPVYKVHQDLYEDTDLKFTDKLPEDYDVLFICSGHGHSRKFLEKHGIPAQVKIIDLSNDFRLEKDAAFRDRNFVYGLPEVNREKIRAANAIANPGCFATAIQLGLLPLANASGLEEIYTTGITGSTGAGQALSATGHFSWRANNIQAYKTLSHQHVDEILQTIHSLQRQKATLNFVPWRGDFTRGIFVSSQVKTSLDKEEVKAIYKEFYKNDPFTKITEEPLHLKQVVNTNKCLIQLEQAGNQLVIHSVLDNLLKGACGQAVQNMNLMLGLEETTGLKLKANFF